MKRRWAVRAVHPYHTGMPFEDDDDKPRLPIIVYLIVGVLAVIGLVWVISTIVSGLFFILKLAVALAVVVFAFYLLKAIVWGKDKPARDASNTPGSNL